MEAHVASKIFSRSSQQGLKYSTLIGDDDASTLARLRKEVNAEIEKISDPTHTKRGLKGRLHALKPKHKELTQAVINYIIEKCFIYAIKQNEGNSEALAQNLNAIPKHMFGDHSLCNISWCRFLKEPSNYYHKSFPHGRDLQSQTLKKELVTLIDSYAKNAKKLSRRGSSQPNESLNNTIGSKAPKIRHYGSSASSDFRVAAAVSQKNVGYVYVSRVMEALDLSPGKFSLLHAQRKDATTQNDKERRKQPGNKWRRTSLKLQRAGKQADSETREGCQYASGMDYVVQENDIELIPEPIEVPLLKEMVQHNEACKLVVYDLETTGGGTIYKTTMLYKSSCEILNQHIINNYIYSKVLSSDVLAVTFKVQYNNRNSETMEFII
jgi:hypothetical protein